MVVSERSPQQVVACDTELIDLGVEPGMHRRMAETLSPDSVVLVRDLGEETRRFEPVVQMLEELIPRVEIIDPGIVVIPLAGASSYYGSESVVVELVSGKLGTIVDGRVAAPMIGVADGPFAAHWAARLAEPGRPYVVDDTKTFLSRLDVAALIGGISNGGPMAGVAPGVEELAATFRWLGVTTLGALSELPREAILSRFGVPGLIMHRLASGEDRLVDPRQITSDMAVEMAFTDDPLESVDQVAFVARSLAARMIPALNREGIAPHRMTVEISAANGEVMTRVWGSSDPFDESSLADRVRWQIRAWIEHGSVPGGVTRIRLDPSDLSGSGRQLGLFEDVLAEQASQRALARVQTLVGSDAVLQADPAGGRLPSEQIRWRRWGEEASQPSCDPDAPWPGATPAPAPALVPDPPRLIEVEWETGTPIRIRLGARWEPVINWSGPWRTTGRWWNGREATDRYQIVTSAGAFLCVVTNGRSYLTGIYD